MTEDILRPYFELSPPHIRQQLIEITSRQFPEPGRRQVPFTAVETLVCYGLFYVLDPHRYGGANMHTAPSVVHTLAALFRRTPASLLNKMLNLDGSRTHSARQEPLLFASLAHEPARYQALYRSMLTVARDLSLDEQVFPDFLRSEQPFVYGSTDLLGQEEVPASTGHLLREVGKELEEIDQAFALGEQLTEKLVEQKIRLAQHRFAQDVLQNCQRTCVFCGFEPRSLPEQSGLLRASHIKPWAVSTARERVDVRNGLAACPMHDAAFDQGYLTVNGGYRIHRSPILEDSILHDRGASHYFGPILQATLLLPRQAKKPAAHYLTYHREHIFKEY